jgi:preprotein translocase subunit YajC
MLFAFALFAEGEGANPAPGGGLAGMLMPIVLIMIVFYFLMIRPMRRQESERQSLVSNLKKNDRVLTNAGIYGTVVEVKEKEDEVVVKVDDNVRLRMLKSSILRNLTQEEAAKAAKEQPK